MPKLNAIQMYERLEKCLDELGAGKSFETRRFAGLLSEAANAQLRDAVSNRKQINKTIHAVQLTFTHNSRLSFKIDS
jgi:hypothetical protein